MADGLFVQVRSHWQAIMAGFPGTWPTSRVFEVSRPIEVRDGVLILGFPENRAFLREKAEDPKRRAAFEQALEHVLGRPLGVRCVVANFDALEPFATASDDLVEQAKRVFEGDLVDVAEIS